MVVHFSGKAFNSDLSPRTKQRGPSRDRDNDVARNLGGAAEIAGAAGAVATAADVLVGTSSIAEAVANAYGVTIPSAKKQIIAFAAVPAISPQRKAKSLRAGYREQMAGTQAFDKLDMISLT